MEKVIAKTGQPTPLTDLSKPMRHVVRKHPVHTRVPSLFHDTEGEAGNNSEQAVFESKVQAVNFDVQEEEAVQEYLKRAPPNTFGVRQNRSLIAKRMATAEAKKNNNPRTSLLLISVIANQICPTDGTASSWGRTAPSRGWLKISRSTARLVQCVFLLRNKFILGLNCVISSYWGFLCLFEKNLF